MPGLVLLNPPAVEPISLVELKQFCRVDYDDTSQDDVLATLGVAARNWVETHVRRRMVRQTWSDYRDFFPGYYAMVTGQPGSSPVLSGPALLAGIRYAIVLPYPPVWSIVNLQYQNGDGNTVVMNPAMDYVQDLESNPARLTPPFGQMWPVARVVLNAVRVDFQCGYAMPLAVSPGEAGGTAITSVAFGPYAAYTFEPTDVNRPISILGAGVNGATFNSVIASVSNPPDVNAVLRDAPPSGGFTNQTALLVNAPNANPAHWELLRGGIKMLTECWFEKRVPDDANIPRGVKAIVSPARDLRF